MLSSLSSVAYEGNVTALFHHTMQTALTGNLGHYNVQTNLYYWQCIASRSVISLQAFHNDPELTAQSLKLLSPTCTCHSICVHVALNESITIIPQQKPLPGKHAHWGHPVMTLDKPMSNWSQCDGKSMFWRATFGKCPIYNSMEGCGAQFNRKFTPEDMHRVQLAKDFKLLC